MTGAELLLDAAPSDAGINSVGRVVESFCYTTSAILAIAEWVRVHAEDEAGAKLVEEFAARFAEHEATVI